MTEVLNLGAGADIRENAHNVDVEALEGIDEVVNLDEQPWPWPDGSFQNARAHHVLEHLSDPMGALDELVRVVADGGLVSVRYPIGHTRFEDPTHRSYWNWNTAAALAGERKHGHEGVGGLSLLDQSLQYDGSALARLRARIRLAAHGPGPWLSQTPGLYGEVQAIYEVDS